MMNFLMKCLGWLLVSTPVWGSVIAMYISGHPIFPILCLWVITLGGSGLVILGIKLLSDGSITSHTYDE